MLLLWFIGARELRMGLFGAPDFWLLKTRDDVQTQSNAAKTHARAFLRQLQGASERSALLSGGRCFKQNK